MDSLFFTSTRLKVIGKQGILTPDSEGYYVMPVGAFNCANNVGDFYTTNNIEKIFNDSSEFKVKLNSGKLFGEWGHPEQMPGEDPTSFMMRGCRVSDKDTCVFFKDIWIEREVSPLMQQYGVPADAWVVMARLKPMGMKWETLDRSLKDPNVNTTFSGRFLTKDRYYKGRTWVSIERIITFDAVTDQGIVAAQKDLSPRLESSHQRITPAMVKGMELRMGEEGLRTESNKPLVEVLNHAKAILNEETPSRSAYVNW